MARIRPARGQDGPADGDEPGPGGARAPKSTPRKRAASKAPQNPKPNPPGRRKPEKAGSYTKAVAAERKGTRFFSEVVAEMRKVSWPDRNALAQSTAIVLVVVAIVAAYLSALDAVFSRLIDSLF
ncbi:MAG TPA: preprotein translocase subunit SecE [Miltoncostaeaceae bacterium]|nr:preprotein translocase subunit SecE [Miltoncostaeaceae bacterium]